MDKIYEAYINALNEGLKQLKNKPNGININDIGKIFSKEESNNIIDKLYKPIANVFLKGGPKIKNNSIKVIVLEKVVKVYYSADYKSPYRGYPDKITADFSMPFTISKNGALKLSKTSIDGTGNPEKINLSGLTLAKIKAKIKPQD